ncbi:MAG: hypothetical protein AB7E60_11450, partial [Sphingobium sp.]
MAVESGRAVMIGARAFLSVGVSVLALGVSGPASAQEDAGAATALPPTASPSEPDHPITVTGSRI